MLNINNYEKLKYEEFNLDLPDLFPVKTTCSNTTYITKLTNHIFDMIKDTLFNSTNCFILINEDIKPIQSFINPRKKRQAKQELYYALSYIRMSEYNDYKMNLAIGFGSAFYTKSTFSRTYFLPIIRELITYGLLEIGKRGSRLSHKVTRLKSTKKLIKIFNKFTRNTIHFIIEDNSEYIEIRNNKKTPMTIEDWAKKNDIKIFNRDIQLKLYNTNSLYTNLIKNDEFIFSYNYHEKFLKDTHEYFKTCIFGYDRNLELDYNKQLKLKYELVQRIIRNKNTQKLILNRMIYKLCINRFRIKPCRIFNNNSILHGGRIYHMFLEEIPKVIRKTVTINNHKTTCIDFKSMHPSILHYFIFGQFPKTSIYKNIKIDKTDKFKIDNNTLLTIVKMAIVISLNSTNKNSAINALKFKLKQIKILNESPQKFRYQKMIIPQKYRSFILKTRFINMIFDKIQQKLSWLCQFFFIGIGSEIVFIESLIYIKTAKIHFKKCNEYPISIHDGYVIKKSNVNILQESINEACTELFGSIIPYNIEY